MTEIFLLLFLFALKHGICDLALQAIYCRPSHKHNLFSPKAGLHSLHHGVGAFIVLLPFISTSYALGLALIDGLSHHVIDHTKSTLVKKYNWTQDGKMYWVATTVDQNLHFTIYFLICLLAI